MRGEGARRGGCNRRGAPHTQEVPHATFRSPRAGRRARRGARPGHAHNFAQGKPCAKLCGWPSPPSPPSRSRSSWASPTPTPSSAATCRSPTSRGALVIQGHPRGTASFSAPTVCASTSKPRCPSPTSRIRAVAGWCWGRRFKWVIPVFEERLRAWELRLTVGQVSLFSLERAAIGGWGHAHASARIPRLRTHLTAGVSYGSELLFGRGADAVVLHGGRGARPSRRGSGGWWTGTPACMRWGPSSRRCSSTSTAWRSSWGTSSTTTARSPATGSSRRWRCSSECGAGSTGVRQ